MPVNGISLSKNKVDVTQHVTGQTDNSFPGLYEDLEKLNQENLGRAIIIKEEQEAAPSPTEEPTPDVKAVENTTLPEEQQDQAASGKKDYLAGYILPAQEDQGKHIIILNTGKIVIVQPKKEAEDKKNIYKAIFSPNEYPLTFSQHEWGKDVQRLYEQYFKPYGHIDVLLSNENPDDLPEITQAIQQAIITAEELEEARRKAKQESVSFLMDQLDSLFGKEKQDSQASQDPSSTPPKTSSPSASSIPPATPASPPPPKTTPQPSSAQPLSKPDPKSTPTQTSPDPKFMIYNE